MDYIDPYAIFKKAVPRPSPEVFSTQMKQSLCAVLVTATASLALAQVTINPFPSREFGQATLFNPLESNAPNLVEGRELFSPSGIAFDSTVTPPHVYIVDTANNRVLGWSNANNLSQGNFADLVIGQTDLFSTFEEGPGFNQSTGLYQPTGIAVDASGNVYVADSGNNRILRFKTPYKQQAGNLIVDLVIGQKTSSSGGLQNQGLQTPSANSLSLFIALAAGQTPLPAGLAVDGQGNLWVADVGNNRVLGFPPANLAANTQLPAATVVLGQTSFISGTAQVPSQSATNPQLNMAFLVNPTGVAVDSQGNLYVADGYARVIQYLAPLAIGESGSKVLGVPPTATNNQPPSYPTATTLGSLNSAGTAISGFPECVFTASGLVFVCDSPQNRVVQYSSLTVPTSANSPLQSGFTGQQSATAGQANQGKLNPSNATLSYPIAGASIPVTARCGSSTRPITA
jgi:NHL repeat